MTEAHNIDCMEAMAQMKDNAFELAIVDPPYGINAADDNRFGISTDKAASKRKDYNKKDWDISPPDESYFKELFRVSKNQIIWGVNYYTDGFFFGGRIYWDKGVPDNYTKSAGEIAYKSFGYGVDSVKIVWHGMLQQNMKNKEHRIHPTQKPVALYKWLLKNYAKEGDRILDTHLGSGSSRIAAYDMGFDFVCYEIDKDYYEAQEKRFKHHIQHQTLFEPKEMY